MKIKNDQFYTKEDISFECVRVLQERFPNLLKGSILLEPSAGTGSFIKAIKKCGIRRKIIAYDIEPKFPSILKGDFLCVDLPEGNILAIGNPPFGKRSRLAIDFFNHCAKSCHTIAFIVPVQFRKYGVQSQLDKRFHLIYDESLNPQSFENNGKDLSVRCCFQIWTIKKTRNKDLRIIKPPDTTHPDFQMYLYNNTKEALKYFDYDWSFAVPRQGFYDYSLRITNKQDLNPKVQYMFFKGNTPEIDKKISAIDFRQLSLKNTTVYGFGKADVVAEYRRLYNAC